MGKGGKLILLGFPWLRRALFVEPKMAKFLNSSTVRDALA